MPSLNEIILFGPTAPKFKGGIVHYTYLLSKELERQNISYNLISFSRAYPKRFFPGSKTEDKSELRFAVQNEVPILDWANPLSWWRTFRYIKNSPATKIIFQWWTWFWGVPYLFILLSLKLFTKKEIVVVAHNPQDHEGAFYKKILSHFVFFLADKIVAQTKSNLANFKKTYPQKKIVLGRLPIFDLFYDKQISQGEAQQKLKVTSPLFLFFGHVREYKGLKILLRALGKYNLENKLKANLLIAGEFWEAKNEYQELIKELHLEKNVQIMEKYIANEEVGFFFEACDFVAIPYLEATGSGPAKVALAFKKPILATAVGDNVDVFSLGKVGEIVEANNVEAMAKGIKNILNADKKVLSKNIDKVKKELSWTGLVKSILN